MHSRRRDEDPDYYYAEKLLRIFELALKWLKGWQKQLSDCMGVTPLE